MKSQLSKYEVSKNQQIMRIGTRERAHFCLGDNDTLIVKIKRFNACLELYMAIALVTGTSSGIGLATAVTLARGGHTVVATMRNPDRADELRSIVKAENLPITMAPLNVDDDASVARAIGKVFAEHGHVDILVNNAGTSGDGVSVEETSTARFLEVMETNFFGALRCIKAVVPGMRKRRQGCIVNVTSVYGRLAMAPAAAYCASIFALEALSECLA
jgi:NAD(P)-dependent dehydrogenase (short-subunit alcohol dehydrogenase family)